MNTKIIGISLIVNKSVTILKLTKMFACFTEYLLGEDILVAPVLEKGATNRDVYLPLGEWRDGNNKSILYKGPLWIRKYPADLSTLPYFIRSTTTD